jgi:hypothetical protein
MAHQVKVLALLLSQDFGYLPIEALLYGGLLQKPWSRLA